MADLAAGEEHHMKNPLDVLSKADLILALSILDGKYRMPDLTIGKPASLHRWHVIPRGRMANVYLHLQVASDPDRPLHDHPWDNQSVILSGGYDEVLPKYDACQSWGDMQTQREARFRGGVYTRRAELPHRLILPVTVPYTMTLFTTGPVRRDWGFWTTHGWRDHAECITQAPDGSSIWNPAVPQ